MNTPDLNNNNRMLSFQATVEPLRDFRIELTATQNYSKRQEFYYKYSTTTDRVEGPLSARTFGSYSTTVWSFNTAFKNRDELFSQFITSRSDIAMQLADMNPDPYNDIMVRDSMNGQYYPAGYGANQQTVLLTAFLTTYMSRNSKDYSPFFKIPMPNWSINYNGLSKIEFLKKWFTNIAISHKYSSTYTVGNFYTDAAISAFTDGYDYGTESVTNGNGDYIPPVSMDGVMLSEQFNPLIMLNVNMVNSFNFKLSIQKNRNLALSFTNNQLTETYRDGITFGTGYRFKDLEIMIKAGDKTHNLKSDLVLQANITYNSNMTIIRKINQNTSQISSGSRVWMAEVSAEYALSTTLTLRAFFQTNINHPYISNAFPNSTTKGGITVRFSF
jgi:cell surface protein SprA